MHLASHTSRRCGFELLEARNLLAADFALGAPLDQPGGPTGDIHGHIFAPQADANCESHHWSNRLADVRVQLLSANGNVLEEKFTDSTGAYQFADLLPGEYAVRQLAPSGYQEDVAHVGADNGVVLSPSQIGQITVHAGETLTGYDFCNHATDAGPSASSDGVVPIVALSLQPAARTGSTTIVEPIVVEAIQTMKSEPASVSESRPAAFTDGFIRSLRPSPETKNWDENPFDNWFPSTMLGEFATSGAATVGEFEPIINESATHHESGENDEALTDAYTLAGTHWWQESNEHQTHEIAADVVFSEEEPQDSELIEAPKIARLLQLTKP